MLEDEKLEELLDTKAAADMVFKKENCCVCINIYTKCEKDCPLKREKGCYENKKEDCCVCLNVYTKCEKDHPWAKDEKCYERKKEDCCVCINVFTECED
jgi:hypothetical protein